MKQHFLKCESCDWTGEESELIKQEMLSEMVERCPNCYSCEHVVDKVFLNKGEVKELRKL